MVLPGRGTTFIRELPGPGPEAPTIFLLHGWTATADLNFFAIYNRLGEHYRMIAIDHRGHGQGIRSRRPFKLADCADDVACAAAELGIDRFIPVGYSMGGPVAQLLWRRHPSMVEGMVLCATASNFRGGWGQRLNFLGLTGLAGLARLTPAQARATLTERLFLSRKAEKWEPWAISEAAQHDWRMVLEAGHSLGSYDADAWLGEVDVPTAVVLTLRDQVVPMSRQLHLIDLIPTAQPVRVDGPHDSAVSCADEFASALIKAVDGVVARVQPTRERIVWPAAGA